MSADETRLALDARLSTLSPEKRALLARKLAEKQATRSGATDRIAPRGSQGPARLSAAQELVWLHEQMTPGTAAYNVPVVRRVRGSLTVTRIEGAFAAVIARHEALRSAFIEIDGIPYQQTIESTSVRFTHRDLRNTPDEHRASLAESVLRNAATEPFDLAQGTAPRATLITLSDDESLLLFVFHHIAFDGGSIPIFLREFAQAYDGASLSDVTLHFADYAAWERSEAVASTIASADAYWHRYLEGASLALDLPTDAIASAHGLRPAARHIVIWPETVHDALRELAQPYQATPYSVLLAAFEVLLHRYTGQNDVVIGTPVSGRARAELEGTIGFLVDTLPIRGRFDDDPRFDEVITRARDAAIGAFEHRHGSVGPVLAGLDGATSDGAARMRAVLSYQEGSSTPARLGDAKLEPHGVELEAAKFDLLLSITQGTAGLRASVEYRSDLFHAETIARMLAHLEALILSAAASPSSRVSDLSMTSEAERATLAAWNETSSEYPRDALVHELFDEQVTRVPNAAAIVSERGTMSYADLASRATKIAQQLAAHGVKAGELVGLLADRTPGMVAAVLGILKAGAAYVPVDPRFPAERLQGMLADAKARVLVVEDNLLDVAATLTGDTRQLVIDADGVCTASGDTSPLGAPRHTDAGDAPAYVMFTSGSTGRPKGVLVPHRAIVRLVRNTNFAQFGDDERVLGFAPISFDASTLELWAPLLNGGCLVLAAPDVMDVEALADAIERHKVTTLWLTAALFQQMADSESLRRLHGVRQLLAGGDVLSPVHVQRVLDVLPNVRLINGYGPTENTTFTCCYTIPRPWSASRSIPIGTPIANTRALILDRHGRAAPINVPGELYAAGDGVALGYLNDARLSAERFVPEPGGEPSARAYRTGDRARWREGGTVEFLGRLDQQVKIRGFRVEPGEIETMLATHPQVQEAAVIARRVARGTSTEVQLSGYFVARAGEELTASELRRWLRARVPEYLVPAAMMRLDALPVGTTGKVNRSALPVISADENEDEHIAPRNDVERVIAGIFSEILNRDTVSAETSFLDLGGHSLLATRAVAQIGRVFRTPVTLRAFFENPTVSGIARRIVSAEPRPKQAETIAALFIKLQGMTPEQREQLRMEQTRAAQARITS